MVDLSEHERALGEYIKRLAYEVDDDQWYVSVQENVDWSLDALEVKEVDEGFEDDEPVYVVELAGFGAEVHQVARARYNPPGKAHPAEYTTDEVPMLALLTFYPKRDLGQEVEVEVEQM